MHLHALGTDGCFEAPEDDAQEVRFWPTEQLGGEHLLGTLQRLYADLAECAVDEGEPAEDGVAACVELGLSGLGPGPVRTPPCAIEPMLVSGFGMQLHAAVCVDGRDRKRLERVCRYLLRPPFALGAAARTADGQVRVHFKRPSRNGATYAQMSPGRFLARLCALVPPPGAHTARYYGVLAPRHVLRARVVPTPEATNIPTKQLSLFVPQGQLELAADTGPALDKQLLDVAPDRLSWMSLLARVFRFDVSVFQRCQGPMRVEGSESTGWRTQVRRLPRADDREQRRHHRGTRGQGAGELVDQTPMNAAFGDRSLREELWRLVEEVCSPLGGTRVHELGPGPRVFSLLEGRILVHDFDGDGLPDIVGLNDAVIGTEDFAVARNLGQRHFRLSRASPCSFMPPSVSMVATESVSNGSVAICCVPRLRSVPCSGPPTDRSASTSRSPAEVEPRVPG